MERSVKYPDWAEKYRGKGKTIRKVRNGYGLYECTSAYVPGQKYPKSIQKYLGMITEKDGFIPKKSVDAPAVHSRYLEYGLSHFIMANFKRDLMRSVYQSSEVLIIFGVIYYMFDDLDDVFIRTTWLSRGREDELIDRYAKGVSLMRLRTIAGKVQNFIDEKIIDEKERNKMIKLLFLTAISENAAPESVVYIPEVKEIAERYGLKL